MAEFKFKNGKKPFVIKDENDNIIKSFNIDVGNEKVLRGLMSKVSKLEQLSKNAHDPNIDIVDNLKDMEKEIVDSILDNSFDELFQACDENVFAMLELVKSLSNFINESNSDRFKDYV